MTYNKATLIGNVGRDPETRTLQNGDAVVSFSLATSESWRDKSSGERKDRTTWHNIVIWNENIGKIAEQYVRKGSRILIEGKIEHREYTDKDGAKRNISEIVLQRFQGELKLLSSKEERGDDDRGGSRERAAPRDDRSSSRDDRGNGGGRPRTTREQIDDDIPFACEWR